MIEEIVGTEGAQEIEKKISIVNRPKNTEKEAILHLNHRQDL